MTLQQLHYAIVISETGSMNKAAERLYIAQPSLTGAMQELERELGITIFHRSGRGVTLTNDGQEFIDYARQVYHQYETLAEKYAHPNELKKKFGVTTQHYSFAVKAFVEMAKSFDTAKYDFAIRESKTREVIDDVASLRSEIGIHRLVRISPTDAKKRRQTTFASVEVLPVIADDIEVDLNPADVRVDVYRSSGPGGQCVNTTDSAVRLTHEPTGIVVTCQNEKSQLQNKEAAFRVLRAKLYELEERKRAEELDELRGERRDNSFGSQIRNYVLFPYQLVKDLRSGVETGNVDAVLSGALEPFVIGYHTWRVANS